MKESKFLRSAAILSLGGFLAKGIGALYKIPLTGVLGGYGAGLYSMAYPLFCVLLTFSSSGVPSALSRLVAREGARGRPPRHTAEDALLPFTLLGLVGTLLMCLLAAPLSALQGDANLKDCYFALAPSVVLVALLAVFRGYFQGKSDMTPTAISELLEQLVKAGAGLYLASRAPTPAEAVRGALFAVTLSEGIALLCMVIRYSKETPPRLRRAKRTEGLFSAVFPVMAASAILPLSQMADSVLVVRLLARHSERAVSLYGLLAGGALSLTALPAAVCYGLVAATVPYVSSSYARGEREEGRRRAEEALLLTVLFALPCALGLFFFAGKITDILYPALGGEDRAILVSLVKLTSVSAVTLAGVDTLSATLTGMGRAKYAACSMLVAALVKAGLQVLLVPIPSFSVGGAAIAANACYLVAFFLNLFYTKRKREVKAYDNSRGTGRKKRRSDTSGVACVAGSGRSRRADTGSAVGGDA